MAKARILILGHSFIRRLHNVLKQDNNSYTQQLGINHPTIICKWHGVGGRTVHKVMKYDLDSVANFGPDIVILQLGSNDLVESSSLYVGSAIEDLVRLLHEVYHVDVVCVCQTVRRDAKDESFNSRVGLLSRYLKTVLESIPYAIYWSHRGFWRSKNNLLLDDGVHLNSRGQHKLYRSLRGAVLKCLRLLDSV